MKNTKKSIAILLCLVLCLAFSTTVFAESSSVVTKTLDVCHVDGSTGQEIFESVEVQVDTSAKELFHPGYFPGGGTLPPSTRGIIGHNGITPVVNPAIGPSRGVVSLEVYNPSKAEPYSSGSGFLIGPKTVITAAHVVYDSDTRTYAKRVAVIPARTGETGPFGSETITSSTQYTVSPSYRNGVDSDDWAIIHLSTALGDTSGYFGLYWKDNFVDTPVICYGYPAYLYPDYQPGNVPDESTLLEINRIMYYSIGTIKEIRPNGNFAGDWDTTRGFSGGPLVILPEGQTNYCAIGVFYAGCEDDDYYQDYGYTQGKAFSVARPLSPDLFQYFVSVATAE